MSANLASTPSQVDPRVLGHIQDRFSQSTLCSAEQIQGSIQGGLSLLDHQMDRPKNGQWQGEAGFILSMLKNTAADGLDVQLSKGFISKEAHQADMAYLGQAKQQASQALFSTASPLAAAQALSKNIGPMKAKCEEICSGLEKMVELERQAHTAAHTQRRSADSLMTSPKDTQGPNKGV